MSLFIGNETRLAFDNTNDVQNPLNDNDTAHSEHLQDSFRGHDLKTTAKVLFTSRLWALAQTERLESFELLNVGNDDHYEIATQPESWGPTLVILVKTFYESNESVPNWSQASWKWAMTACHMTDCFWHTKSLCLDSTNHSVSGFSMC